MWRISKINLAWVAAHPDGAGGLGFFAWSTRAFRTVFFGFSALAATTVSNRIQYGGESLADARGPVVAFIVLECLLLLAPQFFFAGSLIKARYAALAGYGLTGFKMTRAFDHQWTAPPASNGAELLDSPLDVTPRSAIQARLGEKAPASSQARFSVKVSRATEPRT